MNAEQLLKHYEQVAEAPDAIARLRRLVISLAVRGRLVPQESGDSPHPELLVKLKSSCSAATCQPLGWVQSTVGSLLDFQYGSGLKAADRLLEGPVAVYGSNGVVGFTDVPLTKKPSIIVGRKGSAGALNISDGPSWTTDVAFFVEAPDYFDLRFLFHALTALDLEKLGKGVKPGLSRSDAYALPISVPPLAEQHRVVAKVDELMALCDRLEAARAQREATRNRLTASTLARLNTPEPPASPDDDASRGSSFQFDAGFALQVLPALTTRPDQIKQLRQTILNLAVRGMLVPQDLSDEPASKLVSRIRAQRPNSKGKAKCLEPLTDAELEQAPFALPPGWVWARFPELGIFGRGKSKHRPRNDAALFEGGTHRVVQTGDVARSAGVIKTYTGLYNDVGLAQSWKWPAGTLCITIAANIADSGILTFDACFPDSVVGLVPATDFENARYFEYFLRTAKANLLEFAPATAQKNINLEILSALLVPLPPLAEQRRIVAKVDELMSLCDQLVAGLTRGENTRSRLLNALLHEALAPSESVLEAA